MGSRTKKILEMCSNYTHDLMLARDDESVVHSSPAPTISESTEYAFENILEDSYNVSNLDTYLTEFGNNTEELEYTSNLGRVESAVSPITLTNIEVNNQQAADLLDNSFVPSGSDFSIGSSDEYVPGTESDSESSPEDIVVPIKEALSKSLSKRGGRKKSAENTRKRKTNPKQWNRNVKKMMKDKGKQYISSSNKIILAKILKDPCACRLKCFQKFKLEERQEIFDNFYQISSEAQNQFIAGLVEEHTKKVERLRNDKTTGSRRTFSRKYFLQKTDERIQVCQIMFLNTLSVTLKKVRIIVEKKRASNTGMCSEDRRGKHGNQFKIPEADKETIRTHIKLFPSYKSHYAREHSGKKYLSSDLSIARMYRLYVQYCQENNLSVRKESVYRKIFVEEFNLSFHKPHLDTCGKCDKFELRLKCIENLDERQSIENERNKHLDLAKTSYDEKKTDKNRSKEDESIVTASFDLQKCLPTPYLTSGIAFYKRQLWTLNLTVYETNKNGPASCYCYIWDETIAKRGGQEIGACIFQYLKCLPPEVKEVNLYSDSCSGQNRNIYICLMLLYTVQHLKQSGRNIIINHKFLEAGHTHMEADTIHAAIEKTKKNTTAKIDLPRDWANLIRLVPRKSPIKVIEMEQSHFLNFKSLLDTSFIHRKKNTAGHSVNWLRLKFMQYRPENPASILYKESFSTEENFKTLDLSRRNSTRYSRLKDLQPQNDKPLSLSDEKLNDLKSLLPYISKNSRPFYERFLENLTSNEDVEDFLPDEKSEDEYEV